jgi:hypothetical protein
MKIAPETKKFIKSLGKTVINKSVTPIIVGYETLKDEYTINLKFKPAFFQGSFRPNLKSERDDLLAIIEKHKLILEEIEESSIKFLTKAIIDNPPVYVARTRDKKTDIEYFVAKTFIPLKGGKKKEIKVYLGKAEEFNNDTKSNDARNKGFMLLRGALKKRQFEGSL